jgi:hypothetical protein
MMFLIRLNLKFLEKGWIMEEDTKNDQEQPSKEQGLFSSLKPSRKKVRLFSLYSSAIGIIACIFLLVRAYICHKYGLRFTYATEIFINEKLFQGHESAILMYMSYLFQAIAINSSAIEKYPDIIGKISKFLIVTSMFILCPSLWFYCSSLTTEFVGIGYTLIFIFGIDMTLNIFSSNGQIEEDLLRESSLLFGCILGISSLFVNIFVAIRF